MVDQESLDDADYAAYDACEQRRRAASWVPWAEDDRVGLTPAALAMLDEWEQGTSSADDADEGRIDRRSSAKSVAN